MLVVIFGVGGAKDRNGGHAIGLDKVQSSRLVAHHLRIGVEAAAAVRNKIPLGSVAGRTTRADADRGALRRVGIGGEGNDAGI